MRSSSRVTPAIPTAARKTLMLLDGVIGREQSAIGTVPNKRKPGWSSVEQANSAAPPSPAEHAMIEAAIQLDLITSEQAEALVEKGKTLGEWLVEQKKVEAGEAREAKQKKKLDLHVGRFRVDRTAGLEVAVTDRGHRPGA